ncbi:MAG: alpha-ketoglutarate-dependent dioxygenase AlkB [Porticoccaceae bacterium]|jgi:alkylated DNA repair dioxygenase AlkB
MSLFATDETIALSGGELRYWPAFLDSGQSAGLYAALRQGTPWVQSRIRIAGKSVAIPRLNAWYGDSGVEYGYSGVLLATQPWSPALAALKRRVEAVTGLGFNSALVNLYRNGADSVDWHSDDEPELGPAPQVASLSLGAVRRFELKHRTIPGERCRLDLPDGSLLLMAGELQRHWRHRVPKQPGVTEERINITFRAVRPVI